MFVIILETFFFSFRYTVHCSHSVKNCTTFHLNSQVVKPAPTSCSFDRIFQLSGSVSIASGPKLVVKLIAGHKGRRFVFPH